MRVPELRKAYRHLKIWISEGKRPLGVSGHMWQSDIGIDVWEV